MKLIYAFDDLLENLQPCFKRPETFNRAKALAYAHLVTYGRHTITRMICGKNEQNQDWSSDYKFFSQRIWDSSDIQFQILKEADCYSHWHENAILGVLDETLIRKTGKKISKVSTLRDPMSLPFHTNLTPGIRFLQGALVINPKKRLETYRAIPVYLREAAPAKKPKHNATEKEIEKFKKQQKEKRISVLGHKSTLEMRMQIDKLPNGENRLFFISVDGSFCNKNFLKDMPDNIIPIARARKDLKIFKPYTEPRLGTGRKKIYGDRLPTPDEIRKDDNYPWKTARIFATGKFHELRYKSVSDVLWQKGTGRERKRLLIIAPLRYRKSKNSKLLYRNPAYLLVPELDITDEIFLQYYFPRWDIEVNHRDEKSLIGLGDAQVRSDNSIERNPQFSMAVYSLLLLASIKAYGPRRTKDYLPLPKWRKPCKGRPSTLDILSQFRREIMISQLQMDLEEKTKLSKNKRKMKKPRSLIMARKRGFITDQTKEQKPLKLPINIISAILYADS